MGRGPQVTAAGWVQPPAVLNDTRSRYGYHTCCSLYLCERWGSVHHPDHQEGNKTQHKQQKLTSLWRHRCCCSHVGNCAAVRDHVHSRRVSCARAQQRRCTAGISISRLHEEVSIIYILTTDVILSRPKVLAILSEQASLCLMTGWLCWFECICLSVVIWESCRRVHLSRAVFVVFLLECWGVRGQGHLSSHTKK